MRLSSLESAATTVKLYPARMIMAQFMEWRLAGETEILVEDMPQSHFVYDKSDMSRPESEPGPLRWEVSD
jgi:hypothetical protein